jgi:hypothetical protein
MTPAARISGIDGPRELGAAFLEAHLRKLEWLDEIPGDPASAELRASMRLPLSETDILGLIALAYETSFKKDEGVHPKFSLFVPPRSGESTFLWRFETGLELTPSILRRLSRAVPAHPLALQVKVESGKVIAEGAVRVVHSVGWGPSAVRTEGRRGISLHVAGPGDLSIHDWSVVASLRAGRVSVSRDEPLMLTLFRADSGKTAISNQAWLHVLQRTSDLGHGGVYVILTDNADAGSLLTDGFPVADLDFTELCAAYENATDPDHVRIAEDRLFDGIRSLVRMSSVDGCVVLNRALRVLKFGATICAGGEMRPCPKLDLALQPTSEIEDMKALGKRHNSAFGLVCQVENSLAFVFSQDGPLSLFVNSSGYFGVVTPLQPQSALSRAVT